VLHLAAADVPDLPNNFMAKVVLTTPSFGSVPGQMYFDYDVMQSYRTDIIVFGTPVIDIYRYDLDPPIHYQIQNGECATEQLSDELFPMAIPPFAKYQGDRQANGQLTQLWTANFLAAQLSWFVFNSTDASGKVTWTLVRFVIQTPIEPVTFDFANVKTGPLNETMFDPIQYQCPSPSPPVSYSVSGFVKSATTNGPIANAQIRMGSMSATSNANGMFSFTGVAPNLYSVAATASGYTNLVKAVNVSSDILAGSTADMVMSPKLNPGQFRAVLTWGASPPDLDSHVRTPCGCECYFNTKRCLCGSQSVSLDVDATRGYGPETMTFSSISTGTFTYYVYIYTNGGTYVGSNGFVQIYDSTGLKYSLSVPQSGYNAAWRYWRVFQLNGASGAFTLLNDVVSSM